MVIGSPNFRSAPEYLRSITPQSHLGMPSHPRPRILVVNGGLNGRTGNTAALLESAATALNAHADVVGVTLAEGLRYADIRPQLVMVQGIVIGTGTHWDSWSHLVQRFLEEATPDEGTDVWLGKPAAVIVTKHSVGGKGVLSRLQGVLNTFGCLIPPMSGLVYSLVNQAALATPTTATTDLWCRDDVTIVAHNLLTALSCHSGYQAWPTDRTSFNDRWIA